MNCEEYRAMISCALDGELGKEEEGLLAAHLAECGECRRYKEALEELHRSLSALPEAPGGLRGSVMDQVRAEMRGKKLRRMLRYGSMAACLVLVLGAGLFMGRGMRADSLSKTAEARDMTFAAPAAEEYSITAYEVETESAETESMIAPAALDEPAEGQEDRLLMGAASNGTPSEAIADAESVARAYLRARDDREYGVCSVAPRDSAGEYTPAIDAYTPVGRITEVRFEGVTVLLDESMTVFGIVE